MASESDLHRGIYERTRDLPRRFPHVLLGPGDDCAALQTDARRPLLITTDQLVALTTDQVAALRPDQVADIPGSCVAN